MVMLAALPVYIIIVIFSIWLSLGRGLLTPELSATKRFCLKCTGGVIAIIATGLAVWAVPREGEWLNYFINALLVSFVGSLLTGFALLILRELVPKILRPLITALASGALFASLYTPFAIAGFSSASDPGDRGCVF